MELGLAGQSLRLEWAAGVGSCVLLPRDARRCRAFLEELVGEEEAERVGQGDWGIKGQLLRLMPSSGNGITGLIDVEVSEV
jgi:hypothetical protein